MGCDIHLYVEKYVGDGKWVTADTWYEDEDTPGTKSLYKWGPGLTVLAGPFYHSRNYDLFAMLADVRNGRGFAGVETGKGFVPISQPRGLPPDVCAEVKAESDRWDGDGHSHSYQTVAELMQYDWTRATKKSGFVGKREFIRYLLDGRPESWSGGISGGGVKIIDNGQMIELLKDQFGVGRLTWSQFHECKDSPMDTTYTRVTWDVSYMDSASYFLSHTMPKLWRVGDPSEVRIVYWFDN